MLSSRDAEAISKGSRRVSAAQAPAEELAPPRGPRVPTAVLHEAVVKQTDDDRARRWKRINQSSVASSVAGRAADDRF
jgi:hypothetical protein